jgi:hypothetical protein
LQPHGLLVGRALFPAAGFRRTLRAAHSSAFPPRQHAGCRRHSASCAGCPMGSTWHWRGWSGTDSYKGRRMTALIRFDAALPRAR